MNVSLIESMLVAGKSADPAATGAPPGEFEMALAAAELPDPPPGATGPDVGILPPTHGTEEALPNQPNAGDEKLDFLSNENAAVAAWLALAPAPTMLPGMSIEPSTELLASAVNSPTVVSTPVVRSVGELLGQTAAQTGSTTPPDAPFLVPSGIAFGESTPVVAPTSNSQPLTVPTSTVEPTVEVSPLLRLESTSTPELAEAMDQLNLVALSTEKDALLKSTGIAAPPVIVPSEPVMAQIEAPDANFVVRPIDATPPSEDAPTTVVPLTPDSDVLPKVTGDPETVAVLRPEAPANPKPEATPQPVLNGLAAPSAKKVEPKEVDGSATPAPEEAQSLEIPLPEASVKPSAEVVKVVGQQSAPVLTLGEEEAAESEPRLTESTTGKPMGLETLLSTTKNERATEVLSKPSPLPLETAREVTQQMVDRIEAMTIHRPFSNITIRLMPEELGAITLTVKTMGMKSDAEIVATNDRVIAALESAKPQLIQAVESKGVSLNSLSLQFGGSPQGQQQSNPDDTRRTFNVFRASDAPETGVSNAVTSTVPIATTSGLNLVI